MSWVLAFLGFAALVFLHELGHFAAAKWVGMRVERFALFFPPLIWRRKRGETEYAIGALPLGGYVKITGMNPDEEIEPGAEHRAYYKQPVWKRIVVIAAGPLVNVLLAFPLLWAWYATQPQGTGEVIPKVAAIERGAPAAASLREGDRILSVDGVTGNTDRLRALVQKHRCGGPSPKDGCSAATPAKIVFERGGRRQTTDITPRYDEKTKAMRLGFVYTQRTEVLGAWRGATRSLEFMKFVCTETVSTIGRLFYSEEARKSTSSIVRGYETTRIVIERSDFMVAIHILGVISLSLAIINLFPFLPLDGGHIFWALAEKILRRPISFRMMERASVVGFALVLALFAIGLTNDINWLRSGSPLGP